MTPITVGRNRWSRAADLAIEVPAVIVTFVMMAHITANAVARKFFEHPIEYTLEITQYWYMPIIAFLGFMAAQRRGQHIAADLIFQMLPTVTRRWVLAAFNIVGAGVLAAFCRFGWTEAQFAREIGRHAGITPIPAWPVYYLVPLTFGVMTLQFLFAAIAAIRLGVDDESLEELEMKEVVSEDPDTHVGEKETVR
ncbi:TRAP transporter small permease [Nocardioides sp. YIM 152315]|uniref:TRAP transporter small permease n=1 Tax=Nocardioides sp. YIM 152315 TaxID=3031760 RepID=UPI0023DA69E9|nr:TRAP transporter small permease [Nocardioides sp. YIM 152315]MDF1602229.1 TRAP transporter small permease [Nocardioides sp. YIM 152315]